MADQKTDKPIPQYLKVVTVLDAIPGRADTAGTGRPIVILTAEHAGEIEQMMFSLRDATLLSERLRAILEHFDGAPLETLTPWMPTPFLAQSRRKPPPAAPPPPPAQGIIIDLKCADGCRRQIKIVGGYVRGRRTYLLYEHRARRSGSRCIMRIDGRTQLSWLSSSAEEFLPFREWKKFDELRAGDTIMIGSKMARKLDQKALERKTGHETFNVADWL